jgi:Cell wall-active antibiotics response 4TMS YvqF
MRLIRALLLLKLGFWAGFMASAALVRRVLPSRGDEDSDEVALTAIFGGVELTSRAQAFRGGTMLAWFGGVAVDLTQARLAPGAELAIGALFGGVDVKVPAGWRVESTARAFFGGVSDDVAEPDDPAAPTLVVQSTTAFGGVSVRAAADWPES